MYKCARMYLVIASVLILVNQNGSWFTLALNEGDDDDDDDDVFAFFFYPPRLRVRKIENKLWNITLGFYFLFLSMEKQNSFKTIWIGRNCFSFEERCAIYVGIPMAILPGQDVIFHSQMDDLFHLS